MDKAAHDGAQAAYHLGDLCLFTILNYCRFCYKARMALRPIRILEIAVAAYLYVITAKNVAVRARASLVRFLLITFLYKSLWIV